MGNVMYKLLDRKEDANSHFINQDRSIDPTKKINFNHRYGILNPYWLPGPKGERVYKRYIAGCPIFDVIEQDKQKIDFNIANGIVEFKAGGDIILDEEDNKLLIQWLDDHPNNTSSKNHNPDKHEAQFFKYDPKVAVKEEKNAADIEDQAMEIIRGLKDDPIKLKAVANLFKETASMSSTVEDQEVYLALRAIAKESPAVFIAAIGDKSKSVLGDVLKAKKYSIINRDAKGFYYEGTEGVIYEPGSKKDNDANDELVKYLMSRDGSEQYSMLLVKIQQKEIELNAPAGVKDKAEKKKE